MCAVAVWSSVAVWLTVQTLPGCTPCYDDDDDSDDDSNDDEEKEHKKLALTKGWFSASRKIAATPPSLTVCVCVCLSRLADKSRAFSPHGDPKKQAVGPEDLRATSLGRPVMSPYPMSHRDMAKLSHDQHLLHYNSCESHLGLLW